MIEITICDQIVHVAHDVKPDDLVEALDEIDCISAYYSQWSGLEITCFTAEAIAAMSEIKKHLKACGFKVENRHKRGMMVDLDIKVRATHSLTCPSCEWNITRAALDTHIDSPECLMAQQMAKHHADGFVEIRGAPEKAVARANIDTRLIVSGMTLGVNHDGKPIALGGIDYIRLCPAWSLALAKCTIVPLDLRIVVIEHCDEHPNARKALIAALKLGPGRVKAHAPQANADKTVATKSRQKTEKQRMIDLFNQALLSVG